MYRCLDVDAFIMLGWVSFSIVTVVTVNMHVYLLN